jgi:hypothetical protein
MGAHIANTLPDDLKARFIKTVFAPVWEGIHLVRPRLSIGKLGGAIRQLHVVASCTLPEVAVIVRAGDA